jgi:hypothetical protein
MDANNHMNDEDHVNPQPDDQTHQANRGAGLGDPEMDITVSLVKQHVEIIFKRHSATSAPVESHVF